MLNIKQSGFVSSFLGQSELLRFLGSLDLLEDYHGRCSPLGCVGGLTEAEPPSVLLIEVQHMAAETETGRWRVLESSAELPACSHPRTNHRWPS